MWNRFYLTLLLFVSLSLSGESVHADPTPKSATPANAAANFAHDFVLHLPGIAGERWVDTQMTGGLREAGYAGAMEIYDWTGNDPGLAALRSYERNQAEAAKIADQLTARFRADPASKIIITSHSGGTGLAIWALEKLPADVKVETVMLISSALSPQYDLSKALTHVTGKCYSFYSEYDTLVLSAGTKLFGTIDGKNCESAGEYGFIFPHGADAKEYEKLVQKPYDRTWLKYQNTGNHIGPMAKPFALHVLAPLLFEPMSRPAAVDK